MENAFGSDNGFVLHIRRISYGDSAFQPRRYIYRSLQPNDCFATDTDQPSVTLYPPIFGAHKLSASACILQAVLFGCSSNVQRQQAQPVPGRALSDIAVASVVRMFVVTCREHTRANQALQSLHLRLNLRGIRLKGLSFPNELPHMSDDGPKCRMCV